MDEQDFDNFCTYPELIRYCVAYWQTIRWRNGRYVLGWGYIASPVYQSNSGFPSRIETEVSESRAARFLLIEKRRPGKMVDKHSPK